MDDFAVFIVTHGRADRVYTSTSLRKCGYSGKIYYIIDDEDDQGEAYREKYGDSVVEFCKKDVAEWTDTMSPSKKRNAVVFARNKCWDIASSIGVTHFCVMDDDYKYFGIRFAEDGKLKERRITNLDVIFRAFCGFLDESNAIAVCMAQGGDYYSVMCRPDCVKVSIMGSKNMRMHHCVEWDYCVPQIINEAWKKKEG